MRLLNCTGFRNVMFTDKCIRGSKKVCAALLFTMVFLFNCGVFAQWSNNPKVNCKFALNVQSPFVSSDKNGGGFILWESGVDRLNRNLNCLKFNQYGEIEFKISAKNVVAANSIERNPVAAAFNNGSLFLIWRDLSDNKWGELRLQKVNKNGFYDFIPEGLRITHNSFIESEFVIDVVESFEAAFVSYIFYDSVNLKYGAAIQKISEKGKEEFGNNGKIAYETQNKISDLKILTSINAVFIFWLEKFGSSTVINSMAVDFNGDILFEKKNIVFTTENILSFDCKIFAGRKAFVVWETKDGKEKIFTQAIDEKGNLIMKNFNAQNLSFYENRKKPLLIESEDGIFQVWINEFHSRKELRVQKYDGDVNALWNGEGVLIASIHSDQSEYFAVSDYCGGIITVFKNAIEKSGKDFLYAQRIDSGGIAAWKKEGVEIASNEKSSKKLIKVLTGKTGGAVALFYDDRDNSASIYAMRVSNSGKYTFDIFDLSSSIDSSGFVIINWKTFGEINNKGFAIERAGADLNFNKVKFIESKKNAGINEYYYSEKVPFSGDIYYRIAQIDLESNVDNSSVVRLNYFKVSEGFTLAQNDPNPFSDSTLIKFYLPAICSPEIEIFNDRIEPIYRYKYEGLSPGENFFTFYSNELPEGVYFYKIKACDNYEVKKMVISR